VATKKKDSGETEVRGTYRAEYDFLGEVSSPRDGWALPGRIQVHAELPDGIQVDVDVVIAEGRTKARSATVTALLEQGIGWQALSRAPVRDIMAVGVRDALRKVNTYGGGMDSPVLGLGLPREEDKDEVDQIVRAAVGYRPRTEGFVREGE
jgi:hypothetical protein